MVIQQIVDYLKLVVVFIKYMKKIIIKIIIVLLLIYIGMSIFEMIDCYKESKQVEVQTIVEEHQSEYVDYASVQATQRRRGLMIID